MRSMFFDQVRSLIRSEAVLVIAAVAAILSAFAFPPTAQNLGVYADAIDMRTIGLLFCLMTVVAGFMRAGLLARMRSVLCRRTNTQRRLSLLIVALSFFAAMIVTNDVALISFAPLTLLLFQGVDARSLIVTLVTQTVAANLGSMVTPIGNPQNIYLYSTFELGFGEFFSAVAPYGALGLLASLAPCLLVPDAPMQTEKVELIPIDTRRALAYGPCSPSRSPASGGS